MDIYNRFKAVGEYAAAGLYEELDRSLFYRKALGIRRYYENCKLPNYNGEYLYPSGIIERNTKIFPGYLNGMEIDYNAFSDEDRELADIFIGDFHKFHSTLPLEHTVAGNMYVHAMPNYERILAEGLTSYIERIHLIDDVDMKEGLLHLVEGVKTYVNRCVEYLVSVSADEKLINALKKVPLYKAENIYEAIVAWNFILYLDNCDNLGCVASGLYPYYDGENVVPLLENLYANLNICNGYSMALGVDYNPLTVQCLEASKGKRRPMIELFVDVTTPDEVWEKAFEVIRTYNGQPAFYNNHVIMKGLKNKFPEIRVEDLKKLCGGGCTETMLAGLSNVGSLDAGINLLLILEQVICSKLATSKSFDEFYDCYISAVSSVVDKVTNEISYSQKERAKYNPVPMRTLLIDDCIDKGIEYNNGGARYKWSIISFPGMINVIDSMLAIRDFVFEENKYTPETFIEFLARDDEDFINKMRSHSVCFGNDDSEVNVFANKISTDIYALLDDKKPYLGTGFIPASILFEQAANAGKGIGATPDGRRRGAPLADSLAAIFGKDTKGPTALLKSVTSLDLKRALGIPVLNFNINPDFDNHILKALIMGYMNLGGVQMQITCISAKVLQEAYEHPELHRNLVVRVGGYSEYFCNLSDEMKRVIINRTIQNEV